MPNRPGDAAAAARQRQAGTGRKIIALLAVVVLLYAGAQWWTSRQQSGPERPGMASGTVVDSSRSGSEQRLTVRYEVDGDDHRVEGTVDSAAFAAQGRVVWVCFKPSDPGDARLRLPQDELCGQR